MQRRTFLRSSSVLALTSLVPLASAANAPRQPKFSLKYAPHPGTFKTKAGADYLDQVRFAADQGFTAWEDNGIKEHTPAMQEKIGSELKRLGMTMGVFVAYGSFDRPTFVRKDQATWVRDHADDHRFRGRGEARGRDVDDGGARLRGPAAQGRCEMESLRRAAPRRGVSICQRG